MSGILGSTVLAQRATPAETAAKFTGTWKINLDLSPQFRPQGGRQGAAGLYRAPGSAGGARTLALQRGGGRGGGGGGGAAPSNDPRELAGQQVIRGFQAVAETVQIEATAESVTFTDQRGVRTYAVDNKTTKIEVNEVEITTKSRWDRNTLRQEFIYGETKVSHAWELDDAGNRITFTLRVDNFSGGVGRQARAVYDKQ